MHISDYGYTDPNDCSPCLPARVVGEHRGRYQIVCDAGAGFATLRGGAYYYGGETFPTVGDFVLLDWQQAGDSAIVRTLPRRSCFARRDPTPGRVAQAVAANFDTVLIAQSLNQDFNLPRLERTLALALQSGGAPVILLTKADLCTDAQPYLAAVQQRYQALRAGAWSEESLMRMLDECEAAVFASGAYERDYARWPQTAHWDGMQDLGKFRAYVKARLAAMDAFMQELQNGVGAAQPG